MDVGYGIEEGSTAECRIDKEERRHAERVAPEQIADCEVKRAESYRLGIGKRRATRGMSR